MMIRRKVTKRMKRRRMGGMMVMLTNFSEVDFLSKMEGKAPITSPNKAVFVAILLQIFFARLEESTKSACCLLEGWRVNESPCSAVFRFL